MHPEQFIERHVSLILTQGGYAPDVVHVATREAIKHFRTTPCFGKGQAFAKCLAQGKRMAKVLQRTLRQQEKAASKAAKPAKRKGVSHG